MLCVRVHVCVCVSKIWSGNSKQQVMVMASRWSSWGHCCNLNQRLMWENEHMCTEGKSSEWEMCDSKFYICMLWSKRWSLKLNLAYVIFFPLVFNSKHICWWASHDLLREEGAMGEGSRKKKVSLLDHLQQKWLLTYCKICSPENKKTKKKKKSWAPVPNLLPTEPENQ